LRIQFRQLVSAVKGNEMHKSKLVSRAVNQMSPALKFLFKEKEFAKISDYAILLISGTNLHSTSFNLRQLWN
jgi:hypothetical protein